MHEDKSIGVEAHLDWLKTAVLKVITNTDIVSLHSHEPKWGYDVSTWGSLQEKHMDPVKCWKCEYL